MEGAAANRAGRATMDTESVSGRELGLTITDVKAG